MAFHTIWSVDIGKSSLKAVKLRRDRNNFEILAVDKVDYPVSNNGADVSAHAKEALSIFRARNDVTGPVAVTHPGQGTFFRWIKVPASDDKKVDSMVGFEASQQIPFPLDEVIWDYQVIDKEYLPGQEREVALFAVRREAIDDFILDFSNEDMDVELVSIGYLGLLNFVQHDIHPEEPSIIIDIGSAHTDLVLVDGSSFWIRPLPHSGGDITSSIASRFKLSYADAEKLKVESSKVPKQAVKIFQAVIQPKLKDLVGEIHRSIGYYRSQAGETNFKNLYLMGNGAKIVGIKKFLEEQLRVRVHRVQSINHFRVNRDVNLKLLQANLPAFPTALGCALQALEAGACSVDLVPREEKLKKELGRKKKHAFIAAAVLLVCMFVANGLIKGKLGGAGPALESGSDIVKDIKKAEKELKKVRTGELGKIASEQSELDVLARERNLVTAGLSALEEVLAGFDNAAVVDISEPEDDSTKSKEAEQAYLDEAMANMVWVPSLKVTTIRFPEGLKNPDETNSVAARKFEAYLVAKRRSDLGDTQTFLRKKVLEPLVTKLKLIPSSKSTDVTLASGGEITDVSDQTTKSSTDAQEGGPFYGAKMTWIVRFQDVPEPPKKAPTKGKTRGKGKNKKRKGK